MNVVEKKLTELGFTRNPNPNNWRVYEMAQPGGGFLAVTSEASATNTYAFNSCLPPTRFPVTLWECDDEGEWYDVRDIQSDTALREALIELGIDVK
jgi:Fe2+ transport system protein FeoA